jgi:exo-beta-1,3-glucanase (GH17 family)
MITYVSYVLDYLTAPWQSGSTSAASSDVYIVDSFNHKIKRYSPKSDTIETVAGR